MALQVPAARSSEFDLGPVMIQGFGCEGRETGCFRHAMDFLKPYRTMSDVESGSPEAASQEYFQTINLSNKEEQGARVVTVDRRTPLAVLAIPGFGMDSRQFLREQSLFAELGLNSVSITLPGNGPFSSEQAKARFVDWLSASRDALKLAAALGEGVVVIGQSTGAELGLYLALENPSIVRGMVLIDPAFKMRKYLQWSTCLGKGLLSDARDLGFLTNLYRSDASNLPNPISLNMGCEVSRLAKYVVQRFGRPESGTSGGSDGADSYERLFRKVRVPTLLSYTSADTVIDPALASKMAEVNPRLTDAYDWHRLGATAEERNAGHGQIAQEEILDSGVLRSFIVSRLGIGKDYTMKSTMANAITEAYTRFIDNLPRAARCLESLRKLAYDGGRTLDPASIDDVSACPVATSLDRGLGAACRLFNAGNAQCGLLDEGFPELERVSSLAEKVKLGSDARAGREVLEQARELVRHPWFSEALRAVSASSYVSELSPGLDPTSLPASRLFDVCSQLPYEFAHACRESSGRASRPTSARR